MSEDTNIPEKLIERLKRATGTDSAEEALLKLLRAHAPDPPAGLAGLVQHLGTFTEFDALEEVHPGHLGGRRELVGPKTRQDAGTVNERLWLAAITRPLDFEPYGLRERDGPDCSCGCHSFVKLADPLGHDWGVCANPKSHRCGFLTWDHMGCPLFESSEYPSST